MEKFEPFVSLYESHSECLALIHKAIGGGFVREEGRSLSEFLSGNSWQERAREATEALDWAVR